MIIDEYTGLFYEPINIKNHLNQKKMTTLKSKFNELKLIVKDTLKSKNLVDLKLKIINPEPISTALDFKKMEAEKKYWENKYFTLANSLLEKEKIEKLIKSIL